MTIWINHQDMSEYYVISPWDKTKLINIVETLPL
jgi:hypothetical protein